jgi:voltage-gated potassium channel
MYLFRRRELFVPQRIRLAILAFILVVVLGSSSYVVIEGWDFLDAVYMTLISLTTVGFGEVHDMSYLGRIVTMVIIILGIGVGGYALGSISAFLVGGEVQKVLRGRRRLQMLEKVQNHVIVCGFGKIGLQAAQDLKAEKQEIIVVENDDEVLARAEDDGFLTVKGDATDDDVLKQARVEHARAILCSLSGDNANLIVALTARSLNPDILIVARGSDESFEKLLKRAGADRVVLPYHIGGKRMASMVLRPDVVDFLDVACHDEELNLRLEELEIGEGCPWDGKTLVESRIRQESGGAWVMAVKKPGVKMIVNPQTDTVLQRGDRMVILGNEEQLEKLRQFSCVKPNYK